jgi:hypothetical protein
VGVWSYSWEVGLFCKRKVDVTTLVVQDDRRESSDSMVMLKGYSVWKIAYDIWTRRKGKWHLNGTEFWQHFERSLGNAYINRGV